MNLPDLQQLIRDMYDHKDRKRGTSGTFVWFVEEIGELASAIQSKDPDALQEEFADTLAWLATLANLCEVDLAQAMEKYANGCPGCGQMKCACAAKVT